MQVIPKKKRKAMSDINVVPYIDVMLVLLIVFMVTAPLLDQGIEVELPEANSEPLNINENIETLVVSLTASGDIFFNIGVFGEERRAGAVEEEVNAHRGEREIFDGVDVHAGVQVWRSQKGVRAVQRHDLQAAWRQRGLDAQR